MKANTIGEIPKVKLMMVTLVMVLSWLGGSSQVTTHKAVIDSEADYLTVINVITPKKGEQAKIVEKLQKGMTNSMRFQEGFISANIHRSLDSEHIVVYAQWKDEESLGKAVELIQSGGAPEMLYVFSNTNPDYHPYDVISVNLASQ